MTYTRMLLRRFALFLLLGPLLVPGSTAAQTASGWQIVSLSGDVTVQRSNATPAALAPSEQLLPGDRLQTGPAARLVLRRGGDTIFVAPNSDVAIPPEATGTFTRLLQGAGTLLVKVERRAAPNFEVRTPYLTAVVKGTSFSVTVDAGGAGVHVLEGQVQVSDAGGVHSALVSPGGTARTGATPGRGLQLDGAARHVGAPPADAGKDRAVDPGKDRAEGLRIGQPIALAAVDIERGSRGLVRNDGDHGPTKRSADDSPHAEDGSAKGRSASSLGGNGFSGSGNGIGNGVANGNGHGTAIATLRGNGNSGNGGGNGAAQASAGGPGNGSADSNAGGNGKSRRKK